MTVDGRMGCRVGGVSTTCRPVGGAILLQREEPGGADAGHHCWRGGFGRCDSRGRVGPRCAVAAGAVDRAGWGSGGVPAAAFGCTWAGGLGDRPAGGAGHGGGVGWPLVTSLVTTGLLAVGFEIGQVGPVVAKVAAAIALIELAARRGGWQPLLASAALGGAYLLHPAGSSPRPVIAHSSWLVRRY